MLYVVVFAVSLFLAGLLWLALLTVRAFRQVKQLGRTVADASARIADATEALESVAPRDRAITPPGGSGRRRLGSPSSEGRS